MRKNIKRPLNLPRIAWRFPRGRPFVLFDGGVVVPQFGGRHDATALAKIAALFPDHEVVGVFAKEILLGGGNIHCITQQLPKRVSG